VLFGSALSGLIRNTWHRAFGVSPVRFCRDWCIWKRLCICNQNRTVAIITFSRLLSGGNFQGCPAIGADGFLDFHRSYRLFSKSGSLETYILSCCNASMTHMFCTMIDYTLFSSSGNSCILIQYFPLPAIAPMQYGRAISLWKDGFI